MMAPGSPHVNPAAVAVAPADAHPGLRIPAPEYLDDDDRVWWEGEALLAAPPEEERPTPADRHWGAVLRCHRPRRAPAWAPIGPRPEHAGVAECAADDLPGGDAAEPGLPIEEEGDIEWPHEAPVDDGDRYEAAELAEAGIVLPAVAIG